MQTEYGFALVMIRGSRNNKVVCTMRTAAPSLGNMAVRHRLVMCFSAFASSAVAERIRIELMGRGT